MLSAFLEAVSQYGLPSCVCADWGRENVEVECFMLAHPEHGPHLGSFIRSVHDQRIERLWRDFFEGCISFFYFQFYSFVEVGLLVPDNVIALHSVFLKKIQSQLDILCEAWCSHPIRTAHNHTSHQLWVLGMTQTHAEYKTNRPVQGLTDIGREVCT